MSINGTCNGTLKSAVTFSLRKDKVAARTLAIANMFDRLTLILCLQGQGL
jgi:hypothetical protein